MFKFQKRIRACVNVKVEECPCVVLNLHLALGLMNINRDELVLSILSWPGRVRSPQIPAAYTEGHNPADKIKSKAQPPLITAVRVLSLRREEEATVIHFTEDPNMFCTLQRLSMQHLLETCN